MVERVINFVLNFELNVEIQTSWDVSRICTAKQCFSSLPYRIDLTGLNVNLLNLVKLEVTERTQFIFLCITVSQVLMFIL